MAADRCPHCGATDPTNAGVLPDDLSGTPHGDSVVLRGVDVPFGELVILLVKVALAAIPAIIVLALVVGLASGIFSALLSGAR